MRTTYIMPIIALLIAGSIQSCQSEKYTDKGLPEVNTTGVTILKDGVTFYGQILSDGGKSISEHGFIWTEEDNNNPQPDDPEYVFLGPADGKGQFSVTVNSTIEKDGIYSLRAFIKTDEITSFGNEVTFTGMGSKSPELISVTPVSASGGDTVVISGKYFSNNVSSCSVFFGDAAVRVVSSTLDELRVIAPCSNEATMSINVAINGIGSSNSLGFNVVLPLLLGISPSSGTFGDIIALSGNNLPTDTSCFGVFFNDIRADVTEVSKTRFKVKVPTGNNVSPVTISIRCFDTFSFTDRFTLNQAVVNDVYPTEISSNPRIFISGENFNPDPWMNQVEIGGRPATVINSTGNEIIALIPSDLVNGFYRVSVTIIAGSPVNWDGEIEVAKEKWTRLADFPPSGRVAAAGFSTGGKVYFGTGLEPYLQATKDFWEYDPAMDHWTRRTDFPSLVTYATGFSINGMGYFAMGKLDASYFSMLYRYDPVNDIWQSMSANPGQPSSMDSPGFIINGKVYIPAAGEMYEYAPVTDHWTKKSFPEALGYFGGGAAFSINGKGYLGIGWVHQNSSDVPDFYEYDPANDTWTKKTSFPGVLRDNTTSFSLPNGKGYVCLGYSQTESIYCNDMWEYDPVLDTWTRIGDFPGSPRFGARVIVVGSEAYIIGGGSGYGANYEKDLWRFTPHGH